MRKSGIFVLCSAAFISGAFLGAVFKIAFNFYLFAAALSFGAVFALFWLSKFSGGSSRTAKIILIAACFCLAGFCRAESAHRGSEFKNSYKTKAVFYAEVVSDPKLSLPKAGSKSPNKKPRLSFEARPQGFHQNILIYVSASKRIAYGDRIFLRGKPAEPKNFAGFDYRDYLAAKNIYALMYFPEVFALRGGGNPAIAACFKLKRYVAGALQNRLPGNQAGLAVALLAGDKSFMDPADISAFNGTGLAHMIAVSGYKLTLVLIWLDALFLRFGRRKAVAASAVFSFAYLAMAGFAAAVWRAAIMSFVFVYAKFAGKKFNLLAALMFTSAALVLANPLITAFDIGFQLSFLGIIGIIVFSPFLRKAFAKFSAKFPVLAKAFPADPLGVKEVFISGASAQAATFPVIIHYFGKFSPFAPLLNVLVVPLLPVAIFGGYLASVPVFGRLPALPLAAILQYMLYVARAFFRG